MLQDYQIVTQDSKATFLFLQTYFLKSFWVRIGYETRSVWSASKLSKHILNSPDSNTLSLYQPNTPSPLSLFLSNPGLPKHVWAAQMRSGHHVSHIQYFAPKNFLSSNTFSPRDSVPMRSRRIPFGTTTAFGLPLASGHNNSSKQNQNDHHLRQVQHDTDPNKNSSPPTPNNLLQPRKLGFNGDGRGVNLRNPCTTVVPCSLL